MQLILWCLLQHKTLVYADDRVVEGEYFEGISATKLWYILYKELTYFVLSLAIKNAKSID